MAINPRKLRPSMLTRMLNSTPLGEVIGERQLRRHRNRAGYRIGDEKHVDLFRYAAWLVHLRHTPAPEKAPRDYEAIKEAARARNAELSAIGRDIGPIPTVVHPERKARAETDFCFFCETYFPEAFCLPWSPDHLKVIAKIEQAVLRGGLFAMAMPRGSGKTTLAEIDTNYWKSFIDGRLAVAMGDPGGLSIFGLPAGQAGRKPAEHQLMADHVTAEYRVRTEARGRVVDEWKLRAGNPDNHWFDCLVGCAVGPPSRARCCRARAA